MPKYLVTAGYTSEGVKGALPKGGTARPDAVERTAAEVGGRLESSSSGFGVRDASVAIDLPDNTTAAAIGTAVSASGTASATTTVLPPLEEVDQAASATVDDVPPGS